jgi:predicted RNA-binding Zn-ribbon protein involved in translation (DUF1610 family)
VTEEVTHQSGVACSTCHQELIALDEVFSAYMSAVAVPCPNCGSAVDWWSLVLRSLSDGFLGMQFAPIRAQRTLGAVELKEGEIATVDLGTLGVPRSARILYVNYTPYGEPDEGVLVPLEVHMNSPDREISPRRPLMLFPMSMDYSGTGPQKVSVMLVWVDEASLPPAGEALLTAAEAFHHRREAEAIVSAASAVELAVGPFLSSALERVASSRASRALLRRAGLAGQLEVLLPLVHSMLDLPPFPEVSNGALLKLRRLRNKAAHEGTIPDGTSRYEVAEALTGAIFLVGHMKVLSEMDANQSAGG